MKPYAKERFTNPRAFYDNAQDVIDDDILSESEKEYALKSMAVDVELLNSEDAEDTQDLGEQPPTIWAIHSALSKLEGDRGFPSIKVPNSEDKKTLGNVVVAISGNQDVDAAVTAAAREVVQLADAQVHFVSVVSHVTDVANYGALAPVGPSGDPGSVGLMSLKEATELRHRDFQSFAADQSLPGSSSFEVRTGSIDEEIIQAADDCEAALILVGSGKRKWLEGMLLSDVARQVVAKSVRPVLVVPEPPTA